MDPVKILKSFEKRYIKSPDCWQWTGSLDKDGYGDFNLGRKYKVISRKAHRASYQLYVGNIPEGMLICHTCDNRRCVNPTHLFLGTIEANNKDCVRKGRNCRGEKQGRSVLTEEIVRQILNDFGEGLSLYKVANKYQIKISCARKILIGKTWKHISQLEEFRGIVKAPKPTHGEHNPAAKLTANQVAKIRRRYQGGGINQKDLAIEFGVNKSSIHDILKGKTWKHV